MKQSESSRTLTDNAATYAVITSGVIDIGLYKAYWYRRALAPATIITEQENEEEILINYLNPRNVSIICSIST